MKKILIIISIIVVGLISYCCVKVYKDFSSLEEAFTPLRNEYIIDFNEMNTKLFVETKIWGLGGGHEHIFISGEKKDNPNKSTDLIFYNSDIYYKKSGIDSLIIFTSHSLSNMLIINDIKIKVNNIYEFKDYINNYKDYELRRINVYGKHSN